MKNISIIFLLTAILFSCSKSEKFQQIETGDFNKRIQNKQITSPEALIELYYNYPTGEEKPKLVISKKTLEKGTVEITLIHEGIPDDSKKGEKIVMKAQLKDSTWIVLDLKRNWKCYEGRGHTDWGIESCK